MNIKGIFAAAIIFAAAALSGCSTSEPAESESSSSSQTQPTSVEPEQSSTAPKSSSSSITSSTASSTKSQWTRSSYTVPKLPSKSSSSSSKVTPWTDAVSYPVPTLPSSPENPNSQKQLGVTYDWADYATFILSHPDAVILAVDEKGDDLTKNAMYTIINIPYDKIAERCSEIPRSKPVMVYGSSTPAILAYSELIDRRPDIPEIICFITI